MFKFPDDTKDGIVQRKIYSNVNDEQCCIQLLVPYMTDNQ